MGRTAISYGHINYLGAHSRRMLIKNIEIIYEYIKYKYLPFAK